MVGCIFSPESGGAIEIECDPTYLSSCHIPKPIVLSEGEELTIAPTENDFNVASLYVPPQSILNTFPHQIFHTFPNVIDVTLSSCKIPELNRESFRNATKLENLNLSANNLTVLRQAVFENAPELFELVLADNQIAEIENGAFRGLRKLQTLKLNGNQLKVLHSGTFADLVNLEYLPLYFNQLETIETNALTLPNLSEVFFAHNKLTTLPDDLFDGAPKVAFTDFDYNQLRQIGNAFVKCDSIKYLSLDGNPIEDLDLSKFASMKSLSVLSLNSTNLILPSTPAITAPKSPLHSLNLANNQLANADLFEHLVIFPNLERLYLDNNLFKGFIEPHRIKQLLPKLSTLDFEGNKLLSGWLKENAAALQRHQIDVQSKNVF